MKTHRLKTIDPYFDEVRQGVKNFEVRLNDRDFKVGDEVHLLEYDPKTSEYSGREVRVEITYILKNYEAIKPGYVVFGFIIRQQTEELRSV